MEEKYVACRALYEKAFPGESKAFTDAFFALFAGEHLRVIEVDGEVASMLFSIPYPVQMADGVREARYLYAIATHPDHRGKGYARELIAREAACHPVFLRPMQPSLFDFYARAGLVPFSPVQITTGAARGEFASARKLSPAAYLAARDTFSPTPCCRMTERFLSLAEVTGGLAGDPETAIALYDRDGDLVVFKEWWGNADFAPRLAAFLGATHYELRLPDPNGAPFGMMAGLDAQTLFMAAMD